MLDYIDTLNNFVLYKVMKNDKYIQTKLDLIHETVGQFIATAINSQSSGRGITYYRSKLIRKYIEKDIKAIYKHAYCMGKKDVLCTKKK